MPIAQVNDIELDYETYGSGRPLLLVAGLGMQRTDWPLGFIESITARGFQVIVFDNRDIGLSTLLEGPVPTKAQLAASAFLRRPLSSSYSLADMAGDAAGLLGVLGIDRAHVVGVSMGGMIAQTLAIHHPERVASMASIMSTTGNRDVGRPTVATILNVLRRPEPNPATAIDDAVEAMASIGGPAFDRDGYREIATISVNRSFRPEGTGRQLAAILSAPDRTPRLRQLDVPTLVVHGLVDPLVQHSGGVATAEAVPGSRLLMFPDMGHDLPRHRNEEIAEAIASNAARRPAGEKVAAAPLT